MLQRPRLSRLRPVTSSRSTKRPIKLLVRRRRWAWPPRATRWRASKVFRPISRTSNIRTYLGNLQNQQSTGLSAQNATSGLSQQQASNLTSTGTQQAGLLSGLGSELSGHRHERCVECGGIAEPGSGRTSRKTPTTSARTSPTCKARWEPKQGNLATGLGSALSGVQANLGTQQANLNTGLGTALSWRDGDELGQQGGGREQCRRSASQHCRAECGRTGRAAAELGETARQISILALAPSLSNNALGQGSSLANIATGQGTNLANLDTTLGNHADPDDGSVHAAAGREFGSARHAVRPIRRTLILG